MLVRAGVGWREGIVGEHLVANDVRLSDGYALMTAKNVVSPDRATEDRFDYPAFMKEHGVQAFIDIIIPGPEADAPYGLLEVDSRVPRAFSQEDVAFLQNYANIIGAAVTRIRRKAELDVAISDRDRLLAELQHRVKNNLGIISGFVHFQTKRAKSVEARAELRAIADRIETLRLVHDKIYAGGTTDRVDVGAYLSELCGGLLRLHAEAADAGVRLRTDLGRAIVKTDVAVPLGLLVNEFVTNSIKYAFEGGSGVISVQLVPIGENRMALTLSDDGRGLPEDGSKALGASGTGMRLIDGLARQIGGSAEWQSKKGTSLLVQFPSGLG
jgi:two-component sensor histidine kinase